MHSEEPGNENQQEMENKPVESKTMDIDRNETRNG